METDHPDFPRIGKILSKGWKNLLIRRASRYFSPSKGVWHSASNKLFGTQPTKGEKMGDFTNFKKMVTPIIIKIVFWIGMLISIIIGLGGLLGGDGEGKVIGVLVLLLGPLIVRIYCEILIVIFSINDTLTEIKNILKAEDR